ncbi:DUF368 domain-containing protein [soil metagenome]
MRSFVLHLLRGFAMGSADLVPGVSGGTVALVLGIYRRLIKSIRIGAGSLARLIRLDVGGFARSLKQVEWAFLLPLLIGIAAAVVSLSRLIENLLDTVPVRMAGVFFGLVAGSLVVAWRLIDRRDLTRSALVVLTGVVTFWLLGFSAGTVADPAWWMFLAGGALAICAMILPGISGSFLLLMVGMYEAVLGAVNQRDLDSIVLVAIGAVTGLALFSTLLNRLLDRHQDTVMAVLVGLMAGSLRVLWPWPDGTAGPSMSAPGGDVVLPVLFAVAGAALVLAVTRKEASIEAQVDAAAEVAE